jgi:Outer membrane protein beta-barrel domain
MARAQAGDTMRNRSIFAAACLTSLSLVSSIASADDEAPPPAPAPEAAPAAEAAPAPAPAPAPEAAPAPVAQYAPAAAPAAPETVEVTRPFPNREGFTIGFAVGAGTLSLDGNDVEPDTTVGMSFRLGAAINPNLLLQADLEGTRATYSDDSALDLDFFGVSATAYLHPRFYLVGGLGVAKLIAVDSNDNEIGHSSSEFGALFGLGVEAYQSSGFGLSIELRAIASSFNDHTASGANLLLGFQWF